MYGMVRCSVFAIRSLVRFLVLDELSISPVLFVAIGFDNGWFLENDCILDNLTFVPHLEISSSVVAMTFTMAIELLSAIRSNHCRSIFTCYRVWSSMEFAVRSILYRSVG